MLRSPVIRRLDRIGQVIEPALEPLGFGWRIGVGLVSSLAAREVVVGTLGTFHGIEAAAEGSVERQARLQRDLDLPRSIGLMPFFVFALQCISTISAVRRVTGVWKWPAIQWASMRILAVIVACVANRAF